jgi:hypothetical protein
MLTLLSSLPCASRSSAKTPSHSIVPWQAAQFSVNDFSFRSSSLDALDLQMEATIDQRSLSDVMLSSRSHIIQMGSGCDSSLTKGILLFRIDL